MLYVIIYMLVLNLPTSSLGCVRLFDRTKRRVGDVVAGGVEAAVAETAPQRGGVSTAGPSPPTQARAAADRTRTTVRAHRRRRGHPLAVSPTPSPLEETPQTAPRRRPQLTHQVPSSFERSNRFIRVEIRPIRVYPIVLQQPRTTRRPAPPCL